jgi:hypothetical protein
MSRSILDIILVLNFFHYRLHRGLFREIPFFSYHNHYFVPIQTMLILKIAFAIIWFLPVDAKTPDRSDTHYDFVIVGGGTSGLVVANRISELKDFTVVVIEAGDSVLNNANVSATTGYGLSFGTNIDWAYGTEDQVYAGGSKQIMRAGKAIGGTSTINGDFHEKVQDILQATANSRLTQGWHIRERKKRRLILGKRLETKVGIGTASFHIT